MSQEHETFMRNHLESCYPEEGCGFLIGRFETFKHVLKVIPVKNTKEESRERRYLIDPKEFMEVEKSTKSEKLDILGIYHSHPDHPASPSEFDRGHAWPWYSYVIVSVEKGVSKEVTSWVLKEDRTQFDREEITKDGS